MLGVHAVCPAGALPVSDGLFSVLLGDTNLAHMTQSVPASVFTNTDVRLRIWVSDRTSGFQVLAPDQRLGSTGYAMQSAGSVVAYGLAAGVVTNLGTVIQVNTGAGLTGGPITSSVEELADYADHVVVGEAEDRRSGHDRRAPIPGAGIDLRIDHEKAC